MPPVRVETEAGGEPVFSRPLQWASLRINYCLASVGPAIVVAVEFIQNFTVEIVGIVLKEDIHDFVAVVGNGFRGLALNLGSSNAVPRVPVEVGILD